MSKIIPNTFQTPNAHVDQAMHYLTGDQYKVLNYAVRHVYGWHNRPEKYQGRIALSVFVDGFTTDDGQRYLGVGLGRNTVIQILDLLVKFGLLAKAGEPTVDGQKWGIGINPKWDLIIDEYKKREAPNLARVQKMNDARARKREKANREGVSSDDTGIVTRQNEVSSHDTGEGSCDDTHINPCFSHAENHEKEEILTTSAVADVMFAPSNTDETPPLTHDVEGEKQIPAQAEKVKRGKGATKTTTPPTPSSAPTPSPAPVGMVETETPPAVKPVRKPNPMARLIDTMWGRAVSGPLLPMLMGNAQKNPWKEYNIEGGMTAIEVVAFVRWYRSSYPLVKMVPSSPSTVWGHVQSFRDSEGYDRWMQEGEKLLPVYQPKETPAPSPQDRATPEEMMAWKQQIKDLGLDDVLGTLFDDGLNQEKIS